MDGETDQMNGGTDWALRWMLASVALFYRRAEPLLIMVVVIGFVDQEVMMDNSVFFSFPWRINDDV